EFVCLLDGHPWHPSAFRGQGVAGAGHGLFLHQHLLARRLPGLWRHDGRCVHFEMSFVVLHVFCFVPVHVPPLLLFILAMPANSLPLQPQTPWPHRCSANGHYIAIRRTGPCKQLRQSVWTSQSRFFMFTPLMPKAMWSSGVSSSAGTSLLSSRSCRGVLWGSRPAHQLPPDGSTRFSYAAVRSWLVEGRMQFHQLKRREFITLLGGAALACPPAP